MGMAYSARAADVKQMFGTIAGRYDLANSVLSLGIHYVWRWQLMSVLPRELGMVCDLATGTGDLFRRLAARSGTVGGIDFCLPMLRAGQKLNAGRGLGLTQGDALRLPLKDGSIDCLTVAFGIRNFADLRRGLGEIRRVLKQQGTLVILEFGKPQYGIFGWLYRMYSRHVLPRVGGALTGNRGAYEYLERTAAAFPHGAALCAELQASGFVVDRCRALTGGIAYLYVVRPSPSA